MIVYNLTYIKKDTQHIAKKTDNKNCIPLLVAGMYKNVKRFQ